MAKRTRTGLLDRYQSPVLLALLILLGFCAKAQTFNPAQQVVINAALGQAQAAPIDGRSMFYDGVNFIYRPYASTNEVLSYLNLPKYRFGNFFIIVDSGGTLQSNGTFINGHNTYWVFSDSTTNGGLVKLNLFGTSGCVGCLLAPNNLSDLTNIYAAQNNLGLGAMALLNATASGDLSGTWPNISVLQFNGQPPSYYLNYNNLTNKPVGLSLTTSGTSGPATYNSGTGILNVPNYASGGSGGYCLNCNADTISNIPIVLGAIRNNYCLILDSTDGHFYLGPCGSGSGGSGTVTNVAVTVPTSFLTIAGSPINTSGTFAFGLANASANTVWGNLTGTLGTPGYGVPTQSNLNTWFGGTIQPAITLTTTGTSGAATFSGTTLNIPNYTSGSCLTCYSSVAQFGDSAFILIRGNGTQDTVVIPAGAAGGGTNVNVGSGYRFAVPGTNNIKTLFVTGGTLDSTTNANALTLTVTGTNFWTLSGSNLTPNSTSYKVGIGTTSPTTPLTVVGASTFGVTNSTAGFGGSMTGASVTMTQAAIANGAQPLMVGFSSSLAANASDTLTTGIMYFANAVNPSGKIPSVYGFSAGGGTLTNYGTYNQFQSNDATTGSGLIGFFSNISAGTNKLQANFSGTAPVVSFGNFLLGTTSASNSAQLFMNSTTQGFKPPSMNTSQQNLISSPVTGLFIYNTDSATYTYYNGSAWTKLTGSFSGNDTIGVKRGLSVTSSNTVVWGQVAGQLLDSAVYVSFRNTYPLTFDSLNAGLYFKMLPNKATALSTDSVLITDIAGKTWKLAVPTGGGGGTPGGSNTQVQFNNSGSFGGSSSLTWNGTTFSTTALTATSTVKFPGVTAGSLSNAGLKVIMEDTTSGGGGQLFSAPFYQTDTTGYYLGDSVVVFKGTKFGLTFGQPVNNSAQTFGGVKTFTSKLIIGSTYSTNGASLNMLGNTSASAFSSDYGTYFSAIDGLTNTDPGGGGTFSTFAGAYFGSPTFAATNATTYTKAATLWINGAPSASTNVTIGTAYSLYVSSGSSYFNGSINSSSGTSFTSSHFVGNSSSPGIAAGAGAGTSPTVTISGTDQSGTVTVVTGTTPTGANAVIATITYNTTYPTTTYVSLTPANATAALLSGATMVYTNGSATTFTINAGTTGLTTGTYIWVYNVGAK